MTTEGEAEEVGRFWTGANLISLARLLLAPALLLLAHLGLERPFITTLAAALAAGIVDRKLSRWLGRTSSRVTRLESWADFASYASLPLCAYWLRPDLVRSETVAFWAMVAAFAVPVTYTFIKYGRLTPHRTHAAVLASYLLGAATIFLFAGGPTWLLRIAAAALVVSELETIAITTVLPRQVAAVRSLPLALRTRREQLIDDAE